MGKDIKYKHLVKHETKRHALLKFLLVFLVFAIYFFYVVYKFGLENGALVAFLSWSFFVLCTPVADAGFLFDFPIRLILKLKMWISESFVWGFAIVLNLYAFFISPEIYTKTYLLKIFYKLLSEPWPYWLVILLSALGTFLSVYFADELLDTVFHHERRKYHKHKHSYLIIALIFLFSFIFFIYYELIKELNLISLQNLL